MKAKRVGIFGGSFNPVHVGHLMLADLLAQMGVVDEVWFNLSPMNPLKAGREMASDEDRLHMLRMAVAGNERLKECDIELTMPRPSYTISTLDALRNRYPEVDFYLIIGGDNWLVFDKWKDYERILDEYHVVVYPRPGYEFDPVALPANVSVTHLPEFQISSTFIRESIANGLDMRYFLPQGVYNFIIEKNLYR